MIVRARTRQPSLQSRGEAESLKGRRTLCEPRLRVEGMRAQPDERGCPRRFRRWAGRHRSVSWSPAQHRERFILYRTPRAGHAEACSSARIQICRQRTATGDEHPSRPAVLTDQTSACKAARDALTASAASEAGHTRRRFVSTPRHPAGGGLTAATKHSHRRPAASGRGCCLRSLPAPLSGTVPKRLCSGGAERISG